MCPCLLFFEKNQQKSKVPVFLIRKFFLKIFKQKKKEKSKTPTFVFWKKTNRKSCGPPFAFQKKFYLVKIFFFSKTKGGPHDYPKKMYQNEGGIHLRGGFA